MKEGPKERRGEEWRQKERGAAVKVAPGLESHSFSPFFLLFPALPCPRWPTLQLPHAENGRLVPGLTQKSQWSHRSLELLDLRAKGYEHHQEEEAAQLHVAVRSLQ